MGGVGGHAQLPFDPFAQCVVFMHGSCLWVGFLLTLDFRPGSEMVRNGLEELFSPSGWEEPEHALNASKELQVKHSGRLPVGAGP